MDIGLTPVLTFLRYSWNFLHMDRPVDSLGEAIQNAGKVTAKMLQMTIKKLIQLFRPGKLGTSLAQKSDCVASTDRYWINPSFFFQGTIKSSSSLWEPQASKLRRLCPAGTFWVRLMSEPVFQSIWIPAIMLKFGFQVYWALGCLPWGLDMAEGKTLWKSGPEYWVSLKC